MPASKNDSNLYESTPLFECIKIISHISPLDKDNGVTLPLKYLCEGLDLAGVTVDFQLVPSAPAGAGRLPSFRPALGSAFFPSISPQFGWYAALSRTNWVEQEYGTPVIAYLPHAVAALPPDVRENTLAIVNDAAYNLFNSAAKHDSRFRQIVQPAETRLLAKAEIGLLSSVAGIQVVSTGEQRLLEDIELENVYVNWNGTTLFPRVQPSTPRRLVFIGQLTGTRNISAAASAAQAASLFDSHLEPTLVLGDGLPAESEIARSANVLITGWVDKVGDHLRPGDVGVFLVPNQTGIKNGVLTSLAHGLPVIASRTVIDGLPISSGLQIYEANDIDEVHCVLSFLKQQPDSERARAQSISLDVLTEHYTWDRYCARVIDRMNQIIRRGQAW